MNPENIREGADSPPFQTLEQWLTWQESLAPVEIDLGLERCRSVADKLGIKVDGSVVVTIAGTNGKGSSVTMLEQIWITAGYKVAAYTSPHMIAYNERIRVDGVPISSAQICKAFEEIENNRSDTYLTYFEFGTLAALKIFQDYEPDIILLEVGLGGRLDAVNIIDPDIALITSIGIDHVEFLGEDRESIGREKAGIMRSKRPAVCSDPEIPNSIIETAKELDADLDLLGADFQFFEHAETWDWWNERTELFGLPKPNLEGDYQFRNASGVLQVVDALQPRLPVARTIVENMLRTVTLWGRFQTFPGAVEYIFDVAHNVQAVEQFVETLKKHSTSGTTHLVLGMLRTKDRAAVMRVLKPAVDNWYLASVNARRGTRSEELKASLDEVTSVAQVELFSSVSSALKAAEANAVPGDRIIALGSFLVVSAALRHVNKADRYSIDDV